MYRSYPGLPTKNANFLRQVRLLRRTLQAAGVGDVPVGTVDKFQELEAPVVFYSMATSSAEDVPRTLDFSSRAIASTSPRARSSRCG